MLEADALVSDARLDLTFPGQVDHADQGHGVSWCHMDRTYTGSTALSHLENRQALAYSAGLNIYQAPRMRWFFRDHNLGRWRALVSSKGTFGHGYLHGDA